MALIKREAFKCDLCNHEWISETYTHKDPPYACGKCKNVRWNYIMKEKNKK